jgi:D-serine deaminase-like pyridoxal phosphate-dependent protein
MHRPNPNSYSGRAAGEPCEPTHTLRELHSLDHSKSCARDDYHDEGRQYNQAIIETNWNDLLIDVDLGMGRTGINNIESALQLVNVVCDAEGISYRGIQAYSGRVQHIKEFAERDHVYTGQLRFLSALIAALDKHGLTPETVSGGGMGTLALDCRDGILTEH